jgi:hypothetical protein
LPSASTTYQSRWTVSFLAVKVFMTALLRGYLVGLIALGITWRDQPAEFRRALWLERKEAE